MKIDAVIFGLYETGLGIAHSLWSERLKIVGIDHKTDLGSFSRIITPFKSPHPIKEEDKFIDWIQKTFNNIEKKIPVFFSSDDYLISFSRNRHHFDNYFLYNLIDNEFLNKITDKSKQAKLTVNAGITVPHTFVINDYNELNNIPLDINYPLFIKGLDVNSWRSKISGRIKGFQVNNRNELIKELKKILDKNVPVVVQEIILGNDTNHFKYNTYISSEGLCIGEFTLQKKRQSPPHFGVGSVVESVHYPELIEIGRTLFKNINYRGIGSAEFKKDDRDGKLKLIEINPRYWQQNYLATYCGVNFPLLNYLDLTGQSHDSFSLRTFETNVKWINRQLDFDSFLKYQKEGILTYKEWRKSLQGEKIISDFYWSDPIPALYNIKFGLTIANASYKLIKQAFK